MRSLFENGRRGQITIVNIINWVILIFIVGVLSMITSPFLVDVLASENNTIARIIINMIVPFMWLGLLITLMQYAQPESRFRQY